MAEGEVKISALPSGSSLTGVEKIPMVQGGITIEASAQEIADLSIPLINSKQDRLAGIVSGCEITVETFTGTPVATNKQIKVSKGLALTNKWYIPTSEYSKLADTVSAEITLCVTGGDFKYYDIVADNTNAITIHEGTPSTSPVHYVIDPATEVLLGFITVGDAVIEEPVVTPSSRIYSNYFPQLITTTNQSLSVQTIQGLDRLNALFLNQTDPLDNGLYGWNGSVWAKFSFPMGFWDTETDFLYNTLFIAQEGDYANQAFVFNNYIGNRSSRNISGGGSGTSLTDTITAGENLAVKDLVYLKSDGKYWKADYTTIATCTTELRLVTATILANATGESLSQGILAGFTGLTAGAEYFVGANSAVCLYAAIPDTEGIIVRKVGTAKSTTELEFNPDATWIKTTQSPTVQTGIVRLVETRAGATATLGAAAMTDYVENCTGTNTLTLPTAVGNTNKYTVTVISGATTVNTTSAQTINGSGSIVMSTAYLSYDFISNGSNWILR